MSKEIYWIRHAQSEFNAQYQESNYTMKPDIPNAPLTSEGESQARALGLLLKDEMFDLVIVSTMLRTQQTYMISNVRSKEVQTSALCREHKTDSCDFKEGEERVIETESELDVRKNLFLNFLKECLPYEKYKKIAIFSHGDFIHSITNKYLDNATYVVTKI